MINYSISKGGALNCKVGNILLIAEFQQSIELRNFGGKKQIRISSMASEPFINGWTRTSN